MSAPREDAQSGVGAEGRLARELAAERAARAAAGLARSIDVERDALRARDFESNDYLSLACDARVTEAAARAARDHGAGARASRLLGGGCALDAHAEALAAEWLGAEAALLFVSGYQANQGLVGAFVERGDAVFSDERNHASLVDAARLSRAHVHVYRHLALDELAAQLERARGARRRLVLTESVFSMDGDLAPLAELHALCAEHDAWLAIDEAHAIGLVGANGAGGWCAFDRDGKVARSHDSRLLARVVTGGKALGAGGAFVVGTRELRELLVNRARTLVFATGTPPPVSGALCASIPIARDEHARREHVLSAARELARALDAPEPDAAIVPYVVGDNESALAVAAHARDEGFGVRAVRPPTVPEGTARLRLVCHAHNVLEDVHALGAVLNAASRPRKSSALRPAAPATRALFVVGTDTNVGKTVVSALLVRAALARGSATYWKPVQTGSESDTRTVEALAGAVRGDAPCFAKPAYELALAASPHAAAADAGVHIDFELIRARLDALRRQSVPGALVVELAGGLLVPYDDEHTQADWLAAESASVVLVARSGLGTLNHTLLTLEALAARHVQLRALFLVGDLHPSNRATLAQRTGLAHVYEVPRFERLDAATVAQWVADNDLSSVLGWRA
ncbi:MAG: dethiobiotin synthase [Planctomycetota bacterium]